MSPPVEIPINGIRAIVNLLRHNDITISSIAATFLSNVAGSETRKHAMKLMIEELNQLKPPNDQKFATMLVRVLGSWLSRTDVEKAFQADLKKELVPVRDKLAAVGGYGTAIEHLNYQLNSPARCD